MERRLTMAQISAYDQYLRAEERSPSTREKYLRDVRAFATWLGERPLTKETVTDWKEHLQTQQYTPATTNSMLAAVNTYLRFLGREDCRVKFCVISAQGAKQSKIFSSSSGSNRCRLPYNITPDGRMSRAAVRPPFMGVRPAAGRKPLTYVPNGVDPESGPRNRPPFARGSNSSPASGQPIFR